MNETFAIRQTYTAQVLALFRARPLQWIGVHELAQVGGFAGWRTRVSQARQVIRREGGRLEWNKQTRTSAYRFIPYEPLGRDAAQRVSQPGLF